MTRSPFNSEQYYWLNLQRLPSKTYVCGHCDSKVASKEGYVLATAPPLPHVVVAGLYICPSCLRASFITDYGISPKSMMGTSVDSVPPELNQLYEEARKCTGQGCYTGAVLLCRKMLMNIAVEKGASEGLKFIQYVNYLADKGYVPPDGKVWVDHIRKKGNEATHEIALMTDKDAEDLLFFVQMLLRFIYQFPAKFASSAPSDS